MPIIDDPDFLTDPAKQLRAVQELANLRVREVEPFDAPIASPSPAELRERTIFLDVIPLPADWRPVS